MGSFQITYDDFTGGHYMGNRDTNQPSNTWTGTNTTLDPRGNLIATEAVLLSTLTGPTPGGLDGFVINGVFTCPGYVIVIYTYTDGSTGTSTATAKAYNISSNTWSTTQTLGGEPQGYLAADQSSSVVELYYVDTNGDVRLLTFAFSGVITFSDTLATAGTSVETSLYKYKYRLLGIGSTSGIRNRLYYSDPTMTTWGATDYYEFPGQITNLATRTNDFVVTTTAGIYSVTGVLGESVNIQEIYTFDELSQGMSNPVTYGRDFVYLNDYLDSMNGKIYAGLGAGKTLIGTLDLEANPPLNIGLINPGLIVVMSNTGYAYVMDSEARWSRFQWASWDTTDTGLGQGSAGTAAISLADLPGNMYAAVPAIKPYQTDTSDAILYMARADGTNIKLYGATHTRRTPYTVSTGTVTLAEYWHSKQMVVREVIVESTYTDTSTTYASIGVSITPIGAVDINTATAPNMTSSTISAPAATNTSTVITRFLVNNAGRAYGFKPVISHKGVRIKRVVCICED